ncbi:MAG: alpha/beta hydrolase [Isosphaeraceae bacterium]
MTRPQDLDAGSQVDQERVNRLVERFMTPRSTPKSPRDEELLASGVPLGLASGLAATAWGEGPTVLLAHGWNSRGTHWGAYISALTAGGFRAVAVDAPAHGDTPGVRANMLQYGEALRMTGQELGPLAGVVGHSFGAGAAIVALAQGMDAARAVIISAADSVRGLVERWAVQHGLPEAEVPHFVHEVARNVGRPIEDIQASSLARGLTSQALIVHDEGDEHMPLSDAEAIAAAWPGASLMVTRRYGHNRMMLARDVVRRVIAFLSLRDE